MSRLRECGFIENPSSEQSILRRSLIFGVGVNNSSYITESIIDGKRVCCKINQSWRGIMERCFSDRLHQSHPTYKDCTISEEWKTFSNFYNWYISQPNWLEKNAVDKDLLVVGNKHYSASTCILLNHHENSIIKIQPTRSVTKENGDVVILDCGVSIKRNKYITYIHINGKNKGLGSFKTPEEASIAYHVARKQKLLDFASAIKYTHIQEAFYGYIKQFYKRIE